MPLTRIDACAALVVIDMQKAIMAIPTVHPSKDIAARITLLARAFRDKKLPVVLVNVAGIAPGRTETKMRFVPTPADIELIPELERQPSDHTVTKMQIGAFAGTALDQILRRAGATQIILAGIATSVGVEATARQAYDYGYNVVTVIDAMTDRDADAHRTSVEKTFPRISEVTTADDVIAMLKKRG
jgi:nicotinamidase-related amidase